MGGFVYKVEEKGRNIYVYTLRTQSKFLSIPSHAVKKLPEYLTAIGFSELLNPPKYPPK